MLSTNHRQHARLIAGALACTLTVVCCLTGCVEDYDRSDIEAYVRSSQDIAAFRVSDAPTEAVGEDGNTDYVWTVEVPSEGLSFHVIDDHHWGMESMSNDLRDDLGASLVMAHADNLPAIDGVEVQTWTDDEDMNHAKVVGEFRTRDEFERCWAGVDRFERAMAEMGYPDIAIAYCLRYQNALRQEYPDFRIDDGDAAGSTNGKRDHGEALDDFALCALDYRLDAMDEFTEEELAAATERSGARIGTCSSGVEGPTVADADHIYEGLCSKRNQDYISIATMYEVLVREGHEISGDPTHFSFVGTDGKTYEFSYDFFTPGGEGELAQDYFLLDGEPTERSSCFRGHIGLFMVREITGIPIYRFD